MIRQTVLPFKLKRTKKKITARSGLALFAELFTAMGVERLIDRYLPRPRSGRGFGAVSYVKSLSMMLYGGGEAIDDVREVRQESLKDTIELGTVPSSSAIGDWLRRMGQRGGIAGMQRVNTAISKRVLSRDDRTGYTLIVDPTIIEAEKRDAQMTYVGVKGYRPVVATLKENGLVVAYEFKEGNDNGGKLSMLKKAFAAMPRGRRIEEVLLDAEYYSNEVIEYLEGAKVRWAIGVDKDAAVLQAISLIPEGHWQPLRTADGVLTDREVAETVHTTNKGRVAFRLIVLRWQGRQRDLFHDGYFYHCIATTMIEETAQQVVWHYNGRSQIENHIKEIRSGFGMGWMPSGEFAANAIHFAIGVMTYNLFIAQKLLILPEGWRSKTIKSIRWLLVEVAGEFIVHGRQIILQIAASAEKYGLYCAMRRRTYEMLLQ